MKRHHPDLPGGNAAQAAEINGAYAALRGDAAPLLRTAPTGIGRLPAGRKRRRGRAAGFSMVLAAIVALLSLPMPSRQILSADRITAGATPAHRPDLQQLDTLDLRSLPDEESISAAVATARQFHQAVSQDEAVRFSQSCDDDLRAYASASLLDHCVAFDAASGLLGGPAPAARFRSEDMAARHIRAAMRVSDDPVLAEERIGNIRRKVGQLLISNEP